MDDIQKLLHEANVAQREHLMKGLGQQNSQSLSKGENSENLEDDLEKALNPADIFNGSSADGVNFSKTGKELKEKLELIKAREEGEKKQFAEQMSEYKAKAGCDPKGNSYLPWRAEKFEHLVGEIPKQYSWEQMCLRTSEEIRPIETLVDMEKKQSPSVTEEIVGYMREYNEYCRKYIEVCSSILQTEAIVRNLKDNETYKLKADQITALGF